MRPLPGGLEGMIESEYALRELWCARCTSTMLGPDDISINAWNPGMRRYLTAWWWLNDHGCEAKAKGEDFTNG